MIKCPRPGRFVSPLVCTKVGGHGTYHGQYKVGAYWAATTNYFPGLVAILREARHIEKAGVLIRRRHHYGYFIGLILANLDEAGRRQVAGRLHGRESFDRTLDRQI